MPKTCPECNEPIVGRIDKKFCAGKSNQFHILSAHIVSKTIKSLSDKNGSKNIIIQKRKDNHPKGEDNNRKGEEG